ncbi:MAG: mannose-1-phosphate guanylyltransferase/mannose-6-phosphate isomerase [Actinobacteria bacterium RBG_16_70_17]|nr:MAG: mannose-1-phosphate guanylyltransferase/mannose-6-phosphate isomerase [Actinobacteria bacterium RBG_16_70_17]
MSAPTPVVPIILSGGFGTRLWPASRKRRPKHLLPLRDERTMFRITLERTRGLAGVAAPLIACNEDHRPGIQRDLHRAGYDDATIVLEPVGRNTAPAVAAAALHLAARHGEAVMLVLPADHVVADGEAFARAVSVAVPQAEKGRLVTFGIVPSFPATGYGYIQTGDRLTPSVRTVRRFVEKPRRSTAARYLRTGGYLWNSGMFVFTAAAVLEELERYAPTVLAACRQAVERAESRNGLILLDEEAFAGSPAISIDYAVMEKTTRAAVVPLDAGWSDVGDWAALWDLADHDADGNTIGGDVIAIGARNSLLRSTGRLLGVVGVEGLVVVEAADAVLVAARDRAQDVKALVERLQSEGRPEFDSDGSDWYSWGTAVTVSREAGVLIRRVTVDPGSEGTFGGDGTRHWVVARGRGRLSVGHSVRTLTAGDAARVPAGASARLTNLGTGPLELVLVQLEGADG